MADSAVHFVVVRLGEFVVREAALLQEVGNDVMLLKDKLQWLQTFVQLADHERRHGSSAYKDVWVQQTREVALEVEDVLDEFMLRVNIDNALPLWNKSLKFLSACANQISFRHDLSGRIAMIRARLDQISQHSKDYIKDHSPPPATAKASPSMITTDGWDEELRVIGFTKERSSLELMLVEGGNRRSIVSIVGESGIGKSTLARVVLDSHVVKKHFEAHAWLNLPPCTTEVDALYLIYQLLCPFVDEAPRTEEKIRGDLTNYLKDRRYVIVLDGIEKLFNWSSVLGALPDNDRGSRVVIIDALGHNDAALAGAYVLRVHHLKEEESHLLFCRHALGSGNKHLSKSFGSQDFSESSSKHNKEMMEDVFKITTGFPLAILLLGRLLRRKEFPDQWRDVLDHLKSMERWSSRLERILALSFDDLRPHSLKLCFLYFSMMPQNMNYAAAVLVRRWTAEGFLKPMKGESMEDVGHNYLKELISRGMIHIGRKGPLTSEGFTIRSVFIHRRLHAMARLETQKGSFLDICDSTDVPPSTVVRHLFIQNFRDVADIHMDAPFPKLRSVRCHFSEYRESVGYHFSEYWEPVRRHFPQYWKSDLAVAAAATAIRDDGPYHGRSLRHLLRSNLLRVIELRGLRVKKLPQAIGGLVHLRYLCIRSSILVEFPPTIANLINLQTLDIQKNRVQKVTQAFWKIPTLRHVLAENLPLPKSVGVLKNLQTLRGMVCGHPWSNNISPLHNMVNLRRLEISELKAHHWGALSDSFKKLDSLVRLHLSGKQDAIPIALFTRFSLRHLQLLELHGVVEMPDEGSEEPFALPNLSWLLLKSSMVNQDFMNNLGKLPRLAELVLSDKAFQMEKLAFSDGESGFDNLTDLVLRNLPDLVQCKIGPKSLPKVKKIEVVNCTKMKREFEGEDVLKSLGEFEFEENPGNWRWRAVPSVETPSV